jgi:hypothetical protein
MALRKINDYISEVVKVAISIAITLVFMGCHKKQYEVHIVNETYGELWFTFGEEHSYIEQNSSTYLGNFDTGTYYWEFTLTRYPWYPPISADGNYFLNKMSTFRVFYDNGGGVDYGWE